jgi:hypothetical protein
MEIIKLKSMERVVNNFSYFYNKYDCQIIKLINLFIFSNLYENSSYWD